MCETIRTTPSFGLASGPKSHIKAQFSLIGRVFSFSFGLLHLSPKEVLISGLVLFATIPRVKDWSSGCYRAAQRGKEGRSPSKAVKLNVGPFQEQDS